MGEDCVEFEPHCFKEGVHFVGAVDFDVRDIFLGVGYVEVFGG